MMLKNKKALAPFFLIAIMAGVLVLLYLILWLPIPAFTKIRATINFFMIFIFWILLQAGFVYAYFEVGKYVIQGARKFRKLINLWSFNVKRFIVLHS